MGLVEHFAKLEDPRIERKKLYCLIDMMVLSVCAISSGAEGWQGIVDFGHEKLEWLRRFIPLRIPVQRDHSFQANAATHSVLKQPLIPVNAATLW